MADFIPTFLCQQGGNNGTVPLPADAFPFLVVVVLQVCAENHSTKAPGATAPNWPVRGILPHEEFAPESPVRTGPGGQRDKGIPFSGVFK